MSMAHAVKSSLPKSWKRPLKVVLGWSRNGWRAAKSLFWTLLPWRGSIAKGQFQAGEEFIASLEVHSLSPRIRLGDRYHFEATLRNRGTRAWPSSGPGQVFFHARWLTETAQGEKLVDDSARIPLPGLRPGQHCFVDQSFPVPINSVCPVSIELSLRTRGGPFPDAQPARIERKVTGRPAAESEPGFDYEKAYAGIDLDQDYWTIVGPGTREEFETLGDNKANLLLAHGLTPDSKVLDVGCGTGQLARPLTKILGPQGLYYGTDLAGPAIDFCRRTYRLPHFHFLKNPQRTIPIQGIAFDIIFLGSVFTHMFPDDIHEMLKDLRRLCSHRAAIIADAFVSPNIATYSGSRQMVELNEPNLHRAFRERGFDFVEISSFPWNETVRRVIFKLTPNQAALQAA